MIDYCMNNWKEKVQRLMSTVMVLIIILDYNQLFYNWVYKLIFQKQASPNF